MMTSWARRTEDLTFDKTGEKDAVLIARLTAQLRCYEPEPVDETWGRLRHLGARREQLITEITGQLQQIRDLLECVWPAALSCAQQPFRSHTWVAALMGRWSLTSVSRSSSTSRPSTAASPSTRVGLPARSGGTCDRTHVRSRPGRMPPLHRVPPMYAIPDSL
jgi:hypothetical protein